MNPPLITEERVRVEEFRRRHRTGLVTLLFTDMKPALSNHGDHT